MINLLLKLANRGRDITPRLHRFGCYRWEASSIKGRWPYLAILGAGRGWVTLILDDSAVGAHRLFINRINPRYKLRRFGRLLIVRRAQ